MAASHTRAIDGLAAVFSIYLQISLGCHANSPESGKDPYADCLQARDSCPAKLKSCSTTRDMSHAIPLHTERPRPQNAGETAEALAL